MMRPHEDAANEVPVRCSISYRRHIRGLRVLRTLMQMASSSKLDDGGIWETEEIATVRGFLGS